MNTVIIYNHDELIDFYKNNSLEVSDSIAADDNAIFSIAVYDDDTLVGAGTISKRKDLFALDYVAVLPEYRRHHLGARIVDELLCKASSLGADKVYIVTKNEPFFNSLGFVRGSSGELMLTADCKTCDQFNNNCHPVEMVINPEDRYTK